MLNQFTYIYKNVFCIWELGNNAQAKRIAYTTHPSITRRPFIIHSISFDYAYSMTY